MNIAIASEDEERLKLELQGKSDSESERIKRYLNMADLSRTPGNPVAEVVRSIVDIPDFKDFDIIQTPEIVPTSITFDLFDFAPNHPARSKSDTYYVDDKNILRTHTTIMWYYYLLQPTIQARIAAGEAVGAISYGKVYRKDEIDRKHMNVFHNIDLWCLSPREKKVITIVDLQNVLTKIAKALFGNKQLRFNEDKYPYTDPSLDMEMDKGEGNWLEISGAGVVKGSVLQKLGVDPSKYTGWACGPGLERLAMISMDLPDIRLLWSQDPRVKKQLKLGQKYVEVSKYPPITRDISFIVDRDFVPNNYFDLIRDIGGDLVEEVSLLDKYEDEKKFGIGKVSYTYRVVYRSADRTLKAQEVEPLHNKLYVQTKMQFNAQLR